MKKQLFGLFVILSVLVFTGCPNPASSAPDSSTSTFSVLFDSQGADLEADPTSKMVTVPVTTIDALPTAPEKNGFIFGGWFTEENGGGSEFTASTEVHGDITVYAKWDWESYTLRDTGPAGGLIFYINPNAAADGWKYLEAWTADEAGTYQWKTSATNTGGTYWDIGKGKANTIVMAGTQHPAAEVVRQAEHGGYDDWFLPSYLELNEMYENLHLLGAGGFAENFYWSSCGHSYDTALPQNFSNGDNYDAYSKLGSMRVRAVRSF